MGQIAERERENVQNDLVSDETNGGGAKDILSSCPPKRSRKGTPASVCRSEREAEQHNGLASAEPRGHVGAVKLLVCTRRCEI